MLYAKHRTEHVTRRWLRRRQLLLLLDNSDSAIPIDSPQWRTLLSRVRTEFALPIAIATAADGAASTSAALQPAMKIATVMPIQTASDQPAESARPPLTTPQYAWLAAQSPVYPERLTMHQLPPAARATLRRQAMLLGAAGALLLSAPLWVLPVGSVSIAQRFLLVYQALLLPTLMVIVAPQLMPPATAAWQLPPHRYWVSWLAILLAGQLFVPPDAQLFLLTGALHLYFLAPVLAVAMTPRRVPATRQPDDGLTAARQRWRFFALGWLGLALVDLLRWLWLMPDAWLSWGEPFNAALLLLVTLYWLLLPLLAIGGAALLRHHLMQRALVRAGIVPAGMSLHAWLDNVAAAGNVRRGGAAYWLTSP